MIEIAADRGYGALTVREITGLAGVSTRTFYRHFPSKEECFLRTYDEIVDGTVRRLLCEQRRERRWLARLRLVFAAVAEAAARHPRPARLVLVEAPALGPAGERRARHTAGLFEAILSNGFARAPDGVTAAPLIVRAIVHGAGELVRSRLSTGREAELPRLAGEVFEWALSLRAREVAGLARLSARPRPALPSRAGEDAGLQELRRVLITLCLAVAADPGLLRNDPLPGRPGEDQRTALTAAVATRLRAAVPPAHRPTELASEATAAATLGVLREDLDTRRGRRLTRLVPALAFIVLAPAMGGSAAAKAVQATFLESYKTNGKTS